MLVHILMDKTWVKSPHIALFYTQVFYNMPLHIHTLMQDAGLGIGSEWS